jgi:hypothetical protein
MFLIKPILDLIFFKNPVLIMVISFAVLSLAGLLDGRTGIMYTKTQLAIKMGHLKLFVSKFIRKRKIPAWLVK